LEMLVSVELSPFWDLFGVQALLLRTDNYRRLLTGADG
jgi:hypothetical protein